MKRASGLFPIKIGEFVVMPEVRAGFLASIGAVRWGKTLLRNPRVPFLPWFDSYEGQIFNRFRWEKVVRRGETAVIETTALGDPTYPFRERRDSSGDICLRSEPLDAAPAEANFRICLEPVPAVMVDGHRFAGFRYWFEYESPRLGIHRILDRQTWELGGDLADVTICLRNWLTPPRLRIRKGTAYSTVGLKKWARLLPGNLWARWSLLPAFDMQYGCNGVLLAWFERVSLIRTVVESNRGEDAIRWMDLHLFPQARRVRTNPKTIRYCPDRLDDTDALNLWTRVHDQEHDKACRQFGIRRRSPAAVVFSHNVWKDIDFARTYEKVVATAAEFGGDLVFIDPIWEHGEAYRVALARLIPPQKQKGTIFAKMEIPNMCCTLDFEVAEALGGERGLRHLCRRAQKRGVGIISWMAMHYLPYTFLQSQTGLGRGAAGIFAAKESGRHPDTGYPGHCWPANLHAPIYERIRRQLLGVCRRTGEKVFWSFRFQRAQCSAYDVLTAACVKVLRPWRVYRLGRITNSH